MMNSDDFFDSAADVFDFDSDDGYQTDADDVAENDVTESETTEESAADGAEETAQEAEEEPKGDETTEKENDSEAEEVGAEGEAEAEKPVSEQKFTIKVNKETREVGVAEMTELAQKGADYDRVKEQLETERQSKQELQTNLDEQQETMDILNMISEQAKIPLEDLLEQLHINAVKKEGQTDAEVRAEIKAAKLERQLNARNAEQAKQQATEDENINRVQKELAEFHKTFPDVKLTEELAEKLQPDIQAGMSITSAYFKMENERLKAEAAEQKRKQEAAAQNKKNRSKTPGSMRDSGGGRTADLADVFERELFK